MPSEPTHTLFNTLTLAALWAGELALGAKPGGTELASTLGFAAGTLLLSPDLDLGHSTPSRRWGILRILWLPYAHFSTHRGLSHSYLIGPLIRLLYAAVLLAPLAALLWALSPGGTGALLSRLSGFGTPGKLALYFTLGHLVSNMLHSALDGIKLGNNPPPHRRDPH